MNHMKRLILCTVALAFGDFVSAAAPNSLSLSVNRFLLQLPILI